MCRGYVFEEWQARCVEQLLGSGYASVDLLIVDDSIRTSPVHTLRGVLTTLDRALFLAYERFFLRRRTARKVDLSQRLSKVSTLHCKTIREEKFSEYFVDADISRIREFDLDFIIQFAFGILRGGILQAARYGIWSFHHDDEQKYSGVPPGFWEICNGDPVTGASLQRWTDGHDAGVVLKKGFLKTIDYSLSRNLGRIYLESARWPTQVCADICNGTADYLGKDPVRTSAPVMGIPSNGEFLRFASKIIENSLRVVGRYLFCHDQWNIGVVDAPIDVFLESAKPEIRWLQLERGKNKFLADPFGLFENKELIVFCEDFDYRTFRGTISRLQLPENSPMRLSEVIISPSHMSYPFLLKHQDKFYCIPENLDTREVSLYEAETLLGKWTKVATLVKDFPGVDPTTFYYEGNWWLMCCNSDEGDHNLYVWFADNLFGPWKPHLRNPVKTDIRSARPGGTPFVHEGFLFRPAQDGSGEYGGRIVLNRVTRLTAEKYEEETVATVEPDANGPFPEGLHTLSAVGNMTLVDGKRFVFVASAFKQSLARLPRKIFR
jgi:hypothetical protein